MNKRRLFFGVIFLMIICLVAVFVACSDVGGTSDGETKQRQIYDAYVAYAESAGEDVLSYEEWLESIRGKDGQNGKSAYDIWKENGHSGTEKEFLEWLKGGTGSQGIQGEKGEDGQDGKSAYDIWKENGHSGTEEEFLEWLKGDAGSQGIQGQNGKDGLSAYELFKKYYPFYQGTEEDWIADLVNGNLTVLTVTFKSEVAEDIVRYVFIGQDLIDIPDVPEKEGQASAKWDRDDFTNITQDVVVNAVYTMKQLTVTFRNEYTEQEDVVKTVEYGQAVTDIPAVQAKVGNSGKWDVTDFSRITDNMTVNAVYETDGLDYVLINEQREYRVSAGEMNSQTEELFIPALHDGKPVTVIADNAFEYKDFRLAHLPDSIKEIRTMAFCGCASLQSIKIPSKVTTIEENVFNGCSALSSVELPQVTKIGDYAFSGCDSLLSVEMPQVTEIGNNAFYSCDALSSVEMPQVTEIGGCAFWDCVSLTSVEMPQVTTIEWEAFLHCTSLQSIELPDGLTNIDMRVFEGCTALKYAILPSSLQYIGSNIFYGCNAFTTIYFKGNAEQWAALDKTNAGSVFNDAMVYYYAPEKPDENEGKYWHYDEQDHKTPVVWSKED